MPKFKKYKHEPLISKSEDSFDVYTEYGVLSKRINDFIESKKKKISDYGKHQLSLIDNSISLIQPSVDKAIGSHREQIRLDNKFASENPGKYLPKINHLVSKLDPTSFKLLFPKKNNGTYFDPSEFLLSKEEVSNIVDDIKTFYARAEEGNRIANHVNYHNYTDIHERLPNFWSLKYLTEPVFRAKYTPILKQDILKWDTTLGQRVNDFKKSFNEGNDNVNASHSRVMRIRDLRNTLINKKDDNASATLNDMLLQFREKKLTQSKKLQQLKLKQFEELTQSEKLKQSEKQAKPIRRMRRNSDTDIPGQKDFLGRTLRNLYEKDEERNPIKTEGVDLKKLLSPLMSEREIGSRTFYNGVLSYGYTMSVSNNRHNLEARTLREIVDELIKPNIGDFSDIPMQTPDRPRRNSFSESNILLKGIDKVEPEDKIGYPKPKMEPKVEPEERDEPNEYLYTLLDKKATYPQRKLDKKVHKPLVPYRISELASMLNPNPNVLGLRTRFNLRLD